MAYNPTSQVEALLDEAYRQVRSVPYVVPARWVFYRLVQTGWLRGKGEYKRFLGYLSKARKAFFKSWTPYTLTDDTREALVRGSGFTDPETWLGAVREMDVNLDRWLTQPAYVEVWFEAAAMQPQFRHYTNENVPLLAFRGDVSIPAKWEAAKRLVQRWRQLRKPVKVLYYGDLDPKGLEIPENARRDIETFAAYVMWQELGGTANADKDVWEKDYTDWLANFDFIRVGLNEDHPDDYGIPENPDRPETYQWEALSDEGAQELIGQVNDHLDLDAFQEVVDRETGATNRFRAHLEGFELQD